ncbi:MAG: hypothetical protein ACYC7J_06735 [Syntrophales bacterium]
MALVAPDVMLNSIMGKVYNILTNGDDTVPKSEDNFFSWATPGIPVDPEDFRFLKQGLTGVVRKAALDEMRTTDTDGSKEETKQPELTPALLEQLRATDAAQLIRQAEDFSRLVDFVPDVAANTNNQFASLSIMNNEGTLSDRYEYILRMSQVMKSELPDALKQKIEKFRGLLQVTKTKKNLIDDSEIQVTEPSPLVQVYNEKMKAYIDAALEYNSHRIDALSADNQKAVQYWAINANILRNKVKAAMSDWVSSGYKNDYEQIAAFIDQVMQRDMSLLKAQYRDDLEKARLTGLASGSDFFYSAAVPGDFIESSGWTEFGFRSSDYNNSSNSSYSMTSSKTRAGGSFLGIFGGGGSASNASGSSQSHVQFDSEFFTLRFKIAQVPIVRPWFKTAYLASKTWRMDENNPQAKGEMVSDGGTPPKGLIPAYPTTMILIKDLWMCFAKSSGFSDMYSDWSRSSAGGGGCLSFGPFTLGASHSQSSASGQRSAQSHYDSDKQTMEVPGAQIIGFKCHVLPKSPDPLSSIKEWI